MFGLVWYLYLHIFFTHFSFSFSFFTSLHLIPIHFPLSWYPSVYSQPYMSIPISSILVYMSYATLSHTYGLLSQLWRVITSFQEPYIFSFHSQLIKPRR